MKFNQNVVEALTFSLVTHKKKTIKRHKA